MKTLAVVLSIFLAVSVSSAETSYYSVQVSTTPNYDDALLHFSKLKQNQNVRIEVINKFYAVRIGAYRQRSEAVSLLNQIKKNYPDALVLSCYIIGHRIKQSSHLDIKELRVTPDSTSLTKVAGANKGTPSSPPSPSPAKQEKSVSVIPEKISHVPEPPQIAFANAEEYFKAGMQSYNNRKYESAIAFLSQYLSIVPKSRQRVSAVMILGKCMDEMNRPREALGLFGRLITEYPESPEAALTIAAIADIGLAHPGLKYPIGMSGAEYVSDPVWGYDVALSRNLPRSAIEYVRYQKGRALWNKGQYIEAYKLLTDLINDNPTTLYRKDIIQSLKSGALTLITQYQQSGDHLSAANLYLQGKKSGALTEEDTPVMLKVSLSLAHLGLNEEAMNLLASLKQKSSVSQTEIDDALSEITKIEPNSSAASRSKDVEKWELFESGRTYLINNNVTLAEQTFSNLKSSTGEPFWSKVTDYALEEEKWNQRFSKLRDKK